VELSSFREANTHSLSQEIPLNPKAHYRVHNSPSLVPISSKMHPVHTVSPYFPKIHSNIILPSMPKSSEWSLHFRFSNQNINAFLISSIRATWPNNLILLDLITLTIFDELYELVRSHLHLGLPSGLLPSRFLTKILYVYHISPMCATYSAHLILLERMQVMKLLITQFHPAPTTSSP
jgi:hypothetical protein